MRAHFDTEKRVRRQAQEQGFGCGGVSDRSVPVPRTFKDPGSIHTATPTTFPVVRAGFDPTVGESQGLSGRRSLRYFLSGPQSIKYAKRKLQGRPARTEISDYAGD